MISSRSGVATGMRPLGVTGCEDTSVNRKSRIKLSQTSRLATWNCGGLSFTTQEMCRDLNYDVLVLTETHDKGNLRNTRNFITAEPAPESDPYAGVAIMLSDRIAKCTKHSGSCGSRIAFAEISAEPCNLFIIGVYIPHSNRKQAPFAADTIGQLEQLLSKVGPHTCTILLGDLNCKLGRDIEKLTGKWCIHKKPNVAGSKLVEVMRKHNLSAASTFFKPAKRRNSPSRSNATYLARDPNYKPSQIDYVLISSRWATSIMNCKVKWGISCQRWGRHFDHGLIECTVKSRTRKTKVTLTKDYSVLKSDAVAQAAFDLSVSSNLSRQDYNKEDPVESFINMHKAISDAADSTLPVKKLQPLRKRQVSSRTKELYDQRKNNFENMSTEQRKTAQHLIVKSIREDYLAYIDTILNEMEVAERTGNSRELTKLRKMLSGNSNHSSTMPSKDMNGDPIVSEKQLLESWNAFLTQKFAQPDSDNHQPIEQTVSPEDRLREPELEEAFKSLKTGKAPGWDGIPTEAYKFSEAAKKELFRICILIWDTELVPSEMLTGIFIMLYKKHSRDDFGNYRAICLLCHAYKLLSAVIARRLHIELADIFPDSQAGFRPARGTRDNVCILKWTINMILRENREAVVTFIDYKAAFDTESQLFLDNALSSANISIKVRRVIKSIFSAASGCVRIGNSKSETFNISRGVLQGDIFSSVAFIAGLWRIFTTHDKPDAGIVVGTAPNQVSIKALEYADDAGFPDNNTNVASTRLTAISRGSREEAAMDISVPKTKAMHIHKKIKVSETTESEVISLNLKHKCPECGRPFPTKKGMNIHLKRWKCDGGKTTRSRKGTLADKAVQLSKRKEAENERPHVIIEGKQIDNVHSFVYLGSKLQSDGDCKADVKHRMDIAQDAFSSLFKLWNDHRLPLSMKLRLYRTAVCSTLNHACEAWDFTEEVRRYINGFNSRCLHVITKRSYRETAMSPEYDLVLAIRKRRLRFLGHILRMNKDRLLRRTLVAYVCTDTGPPPGSLLDDCCSKDIEELAILATDKRRWNDFINSL